MLKTIATRVDLDTYDQLLKIAKKEERTMSFVLKKAVDEYLKKGE